MAKYTISIKKSAEKELKKLSAEMYLRVKKGILNLAENPRPNGCKKLK
jgi:mRNA interferase RelE/StbE